MSTPESPLPEKYVCSDDAEARACHLRVVERVLRGKYFPWAGEGYDSHSEVVWWRPPNKKPRRVSVFDKSVGVVCCMGWSARRRAFCNLCEVARPLWYRIIEVWACVLLSQNEKDFGQGTNQVISHQPVVRKFWPRMLRPRIPAPKCRQQHQHHQ